MNNPYDWIRSTKKKFTNFFNSELLQSKFYEKTSIVSDKLPPRLQRHGLSVAARMFGNEIRTFTKRTTGKDLCQLKDSKMRHLMLTKLSAFKIAISNRDTQYSLISLVYNHSCNLATSLSLEEPECDENFKNSNFMRELIAKYYEECIQNYEKPTVKHFKRKQKLEHYRQNVTKELLNEKDEENVYCRCNSKTENDNRLDGRKFISCWQHKAINEDDLDNFLNENLIHFLQENKEDICLEDSSEWSRFLKTEHADVFRRKLNGGLYEYRVQASFFDISANNLFKTQIDGDYRKTWDEYVLELDVVDSDQNSSTELLHWVTKCPYPFSTREYVYLRRKKIDERNKAMILYSKATDQTNIPRTKKIERVETYVSKLIVKPHTNYDENGCDFLLTYYDDPKMMLPRSVLDMAASRGINDSLERMHQAALGLQENIMAEEVASY